MIGPVRAGAPAPPDTFTVATWNVHAGVDGWGRPFDVVGACLKLDADILVLAESWTPAGRPGIAEEVALAGGYVRHEHPIAGGRLARPHPTADDRWMRSYDWRGASHAIFLDSELAFGPRIRESPRYREAEPGHWAVAVLSRFPTSHARLIDLGRLERDRARRAAIVVAVTKGGERVDVAGVHMSHITYGAPLQFLRLSRALRAVSPSGPVLLAGDMNLWGPPVSAFFPGWKRASGHKTWPAWHPHSQVDHVLVRGPLTIVRSEALAPMGSDHLALLVRLTTALGPP